jgi:hypothetical protein
MIKGFTVKFLSEEDVEISVAARLPRPAKPHSGPEAPDEIHRQLVEIDGALGKLLPLLSV